MELEDQAREARFRTAKKADSGKGAYSLYSTDDIINNFSLALVAYANDSSDASPDANSSADETVGFGHWLTLLTIPERI